MASWRLKEPSSIIQFALIMLGVVTGLIILTLGLIMTFRYAPWRHQQPLLLKLQSFTVTNLNVSKALSETNWDTKLLFANQNSVLEIFIQSFESLLYYNHTDGCDPISCSIVEPVHLWPRRQKLVQVTYNSTQCGGEQPFVEELVLEEMRKDGEGGGLRLSLGLNLRVKYRTGILYWDYELKPDCPSLYLKFVAATGVGWLAGDEPKECLVEMP